MPRHHTKEQILAWLQHMRLADNIFMGAFFRHRIVGARFIAPVRVQDAFRAQ